MAVPELPDPSLLDPIEEDVWTPGGTPPLDATVGVRGSPIRGEKFFEHAIRQARERSFRGGNMVSVTVDLDLPDWPLERILARQLRHYPRYATCQIAVVLEAHFEVLATGRRPHGDIVLPALDIVEAERLADLFRPTETKNEHRVRR